MDMTLSDEQMACITGTRINDWQEIELPAGRQDLPTWVRGAHVDWHNGYASAPTVKLKTNCDARTWPDQQWAREGAKLFICRHDDGRVLLPGRRAPADHGQAVPHARRGPA